MTGSSRGGQAAVALLKGYPRTCLPCSRPTLSKGASGVRLQASRTTATRIATIYSKPYSSIPTNPTSTTTSATPASTSEPPRPTTTTTTMPPPSPPPPAVSEEAAETSQAPPLKPEPDTELEPLDPDDPPLPPNLTYPIFPKATHTLFGSIILTRAPLLTRALTTFEESFFLYQKRLNERLCLPFMDGLYFKQDTAAQLDWKIKIKGRKMVPSKEIGWYQKRGREAWNDEELVGSKLASTKSVYSSLLKDAESLVNDEGERMKPEDVVPVEQPQSRLSEADKNNDTKRLDRKMDETLHLVVKDKHGDWRFPHAPIAMEEAVHQTAIRCLREHCGINMNTWIVGRIPVAHLVTPPAMSPDKPNSMKHKGKKIFFIKGRIMAGQADLSGNVLGLQDFKWLTKKEMMKQLAYPYFRKVRNMMADR